MHENKGSVFSGIPSGRIKKSVQIIATILLLLIFGCVVQLTYRYSFSTTNKFEPLGISDSDVIGELTEGNEVRQIIRLDDPVEGIGVLFGTYSRANIGVIRIEAIDLNSGTCLYMKNIDTARMSDKEFYPIPFSNGQESNNFELIITGVNTTAGQSPTVWISNDIHPNSELHINGALVEGTVTFRLLDLTKTFSFGMFLNRMMIISIIFAFACLHIFVDYRHIYDYIFKHRVILSVLAIAFCVINKYHFTSITMFDAYIQTGEGSQYIKPVLGIARGIRSDEWLGAIPSKMSAAYTGYEQYNYILRGTSSYNISATGLYLSYAALAQPMNWLYYILGPEYGLSFNTSATLVLSFLFSFEMCYILGRKQDKLSSLVGAALITFSGFFVWWSFISWILAAQAAVVFLYYFLRSDNDSHKVLHGFGAAIFGAFFVTSLYPAWQVPVGMIFLVIILWIFFEARDILKKYRFKDIALLAGVILFFASIVIVYLLEVRQYLTDIMTTVYPGKRVFYGGYALSKLYNYIPIMMTPVRRHPNPCEMSTFINLFPLPILLNIYLMIRKKKINGRALAMILLSALFAYYCYTEMPPMLAKVLMFTYSTPQRMVDILAFLQIYLLVIFLSESKPDHELHVGIVFPLLAAIVGYAGYKTYENHAGFMSKREILVIVFVLVAIFTLLMSRLRPRLKHLGAAGIVLLCAATTLTVNPIVKGLDVMTTKPLARGIQSIVKEDPKAIWIALDSMVDSGYLVANGAPTINSVNTVPNMALWEKLDPEGQYNEVYNRYAHMVISIEEGPTTPSLVQADFMTVKLAYEDLEKTGAEYLLSSSPKENTDYYQLELLYNGGGKYIYRVEYK
ncbi:MAG: hypothetical protein GXY06_00800 [Clostridiaceae bacterium]|nr:hypothetical protein [Clostridiaceae bacterium]